MTEIKEKTFTEKVWDALASVKMAIIIFALIAASSVVGTVIEQNATQQKNIAIIAKFVGFSSAQAVYDVLDAMGFMDMYHSWWFNLLLAAFSANLIICTIDRLPPVLRLVREKLKPLKDEQFRSFSIKKEFLLKGSQAEARTRLTEAVRGLGFRKHESSEGEGKDGWQVYAQRQQYSRIGVYITHISIMFILIGAVVGLFFGFSGFLNLPEGATYPVAFGRKQISKQEFSERNMLVDTLMRTGGNLSQAASTHGVPVDRFVNRLRFLSVEPMGFMVKNEEFEVSFYGQSDMAKEYSSLLVVYDQGVEVMRKRIEVNDPLRYKGFTFYQSSYGMMEDQNEFIFILNAQGTGSAPERHEVRLGDSFTMPGGGIKITLQDFSPALRFDPSGKASTYTDMMNNPGLQVKVEDGDAVYTKWILRRYPQTWNLSGNSRIEFSDVWGAQFTGLQVRRDPGVWLVYLGCLIMSLGLYMAFFTSHRRVWIRLTESGKAGSRVTVAASAHKGREGFEQNIDKMITLLTGGGK